MISHQDLKRLSHLSTTEGVVSAYIRVDPRRIFDRRHPLTEFKGAVKDYERRGIEARWRAALEREKDRILGYLETWNPSGRGLAIFSSRPAGLWEVVPLDVLVPSLVEVGPTPNTTVLAQVLEDSPPFVVAVVQRDKARLYTAELRRATAEADITSEVPRQHDQGGWSQARFQRHTEFRVAEHLKRVVEELKRLYDERPSTHLAVGGTDEVAAELVGMLPDPIRRRLIGTFPVDFKHETEEAMLERARAVRDAYERQSESDMVRRAVDATGAGGQGVVGMDDTLLAMMEGRVQVLLVADGRRVPGTACRDCGYLSVQPFPACPVCSSAPEAIPDLVNAAVERAYRTGARVETIAGEARQVLLDHGGMAALLRY
jgi:peptide chain release factor subunit 1